MDENNFTLLNNLQENHKYCAEASIVSRDHNHIPIPFILKQYYYRSSEGCGSYYPSASPSNITILTLNYSTLWNFRPLHLTRAHVYN